MPPFYSGIAQIPRVSLANLRVAAVSSPFSIRKSIPLVYTCNEKTNLHDEAAVSFRVGSSLVVLLVAVRYLLHSCVLPAGPDRKRNRTNRGGFLHGNFFPA
jgi:hypothetical protein